MEIRFYPDRTPPAVEIDGVERDATTTAIAIRFAELDVQRRIARALEMLAAVVGGRLDKPPH